ERHTTEHPGIESAGGPLEGRADQIPEMIDHADRGAGALEGGGEASGGDVVTGAVARGEDQDAGHAALSYSAGTRGVRSDRASDGDAVLPDLRFAVRAPAPVAAAAFHRRLSRFPAPLGGAPLLDDLHARLTGECRLEIAVEVAMIPVHDHQIAP